MKINFKSANTKETPSDSPKKDQKAKKKWKKEKPASPIKETPTLLKKRKPEENQTPPALKYDFSKTEIKQVTEEKSGFNNSQKNQQEEKIKNLEDLTKTGNSIFEKIKQGENSEALTQVYELDSNIYKWIYNLQEDSKAYDTFQNLKNLKQFDPNLEVDFTKPGENFIKSQKEDLEKYEDSDYKKFIKKMEDKNLKKKTRVLSSCRFCLENSKLKEFEVLKVSEYFYILQPKRTSFPGKHLLIVPTMHVNSTLALKSEPKVVLENLSRFKKIVKKIFKNHYQCETLFYESAFNFDNVPHARIEAFALEKEEIEDSPLYFEAGFRNLGGDWDTHKKALKILKSKGGLYKQIPEKFEFCFVEWGFEDEGEEEGGDWTGLVHVVEDAKLFDRNFIYEVIGTIKGLDVMVAKAPKVLDDEKMIQFKKWFRGCLKVEGN